MVEPTKIYIVDDEVDVAQLAAKRLRAMGYQTHCFFKGEGVVDSLSADPPHLLLLDILLPDISGIDLFKQLREQPATAHMPIVFFSANPSNADYCVDTLGAQGFVRKPYDAAELTQAIKKALTGG